MAWTPVADLKGPPGDAATAQPVRTVTADMTITADDAGALLVVDAPGPVVATVPTGALTRGQRIDLLRAGAGPVTVVAGAGMGVDSAATLVLRAQYSAATLVALAGDRAVLVGDLEPAP